MNVLEKEIEIVEQARRAIEEGEAPDVIKHRRRLLQEVTMLGDRLQTLQHIILQRDAIYGQAAERRMGAFFGVSGPSFRVNPSEASGHNLRIAQYVQGLLGKKIDFDRFADQHEAGRSVHFGDIVTSLQTVYWGVSILKSDMLVDGPRFELYRDGPSRNIVARPVYRYGRGPHR